MLLPAILLDTQVQPFRFYNGNSIQQGITCQGRLYELMADFGDDQFKAFAEACKLTEYGNRAIISTGIGGYQLWLDLTSKAAHDHQTCKVANSL